MTMTVKQIGSFGAEITDIDLSAPLDAAMMKEIVDVVAKHRVAVFRDQHLDKAAYDRFGRLWGNPIDFFFTPDIDPDFPALIRISNSPDLDPGRRDGAAFWHTDGSYEYLPASFTMLLAVEAPDAGGETRFADLVGAYDALPAETKARIDGLTVRHMLVGGKRGEDEAPVKLDADDKNRDGGIRARKRASEQPEHPLVLTHPITGRKSLYAISGTPIGVLGMSDDEGLALLDELKRHALQPQFRIEAKACTGDVLIWDNFATVHAATPLEYSHEDGKRRVLLRISTNGLPPMYSHLTPAFVKPEGVTSLKFA
ncbi:MAG: TauD/TfdA dioxygenase family protein [Hyphomonadaceae bacterium]